MFTTNIYIEGGHARSEKLCTLLEYVQMNRLEPGTMLHIGDVSVDGIVQTTLNTETFWVGHATPYHAPSTGDGEIGWDYNHPWMKKFVLEVYYPHRRHEQVASVRKQEARNVADAYKAAYRENK